MSKKRKVDAEGRQFKERLESEYMFVLQEDKPVCIFCVCFYIYNLVY